MCSFNEILALKFSSTPKQVLAHSISKERPGIVGHINFVVYDKHGATFREPLKIKQEKPNTHSKKTGTTTKIRNSAEGTKETAHTFLMIHKRWPCTLIFICIITLRVHLCKGIIIQKINNIHTPGKNLTIFQQFHAKELSLS